MTVPQRFAPICALLLCAAGFAGGVEPFPAPADLARLIAAPTPAALERLREQALLGSADETRLLLARLSENGSAEWSPVALAALTRSEPAVLRDALGALPGFGAAVAGDHLDRVRALASHTDERVQRGALRCLGLIGDWGAIPLIIDKLSAPADAALAAPAAVVNAVVVASGEAVVPALPSPAPTPAGAGSTVVSTAKVADAAHRALVLLNQGRDLGTLPEPWLRWHAKTVAAVDARLGELGTRLGAADPTVVVRAIHAARMVPGRRAEVVSLLAPLRTHADRNVAQLASETVRSLISAGPVAIGAALPVLKRSDPKPPELPPALAALIYRPLAAYFLVAISIGAIGAVGLLVFLLRTREAIVRMTQRLVRKTANLTRAMKKKLKKITFSS